jgi:Protein of unknown function (DUF2516)
VSVVNFSGYSVVSWLFYVLLVAAFVVEAWAFIDAVRRPAAGFVAASKQTKPLWLIILGVALVIGIAGVAGLLSIVSFIPIVAFVAAAVYLADVRPKVRGFKSGSSHQGPYGPW